jgi:phage terminase small subunit
MANILSIEERGERDEEFVRHYVSNGGNSSAAAKSIGVSDTSASTTGHRMKERLWPEIQEEIATQMQGFIPKAIQNLKQLAQSADSENVRLNATRDLLDRSGLKPVEKQEIHTTSGRLEDMTVEEIDAELQHMHDVHPPLDWLERYLTENDLKLVDDDGKKPH